MRSYRGLKEFAVEADGAVLGDPSPGGLAKEVPQIFGSQPQAFQARSEALERGLPGGAVFTMVIEIPEPVLEGLVQVVQGAAPEAGEEIPPDGFKPAFDFTFSLGFVGPGMDQGDAQGGGDLLQVMRTEGAAIVDVQLARQYPAWPGPVPGPGEKRPGIPRDKRPHKAPAGSSRR